MTEFDELWHNLIERFNSLEGYNARLIDGGIKITFSVPKSPKFDKNEQKFTYKQRKEMK
jgi:hypothetical protein